MTRRPVRRPRPRSTLVLAMASMLVLTGCGTRVAPQVFESMQASGAGEDASGPGSGASGAASPDSGSAVSGERSQGSGSNADAAPGGSPETGESSAGGTGTSDTGASAGSGGSADSGTDRASAANGASDVGVTADRIRVGNITTKGGPLGPNQFTPMFQGAQAFFAQLNQSGGVSGRQIELLFCDDKADPDRNEQCARNLVDEQEVFALVANSTRAYSAADYVSGEGVPDVGGQPVGYNYFTYPALFSVRGGEYPRDGEVGYEGELYNGIAVFNYFRRQAGANKAAVFYYNIPQSKAYGLYHVDGLKEAGFDVEPYEVNPALPSFDSYVADMQAQNVEIIFDTMDLTGNQNLCRSMERNNFSVKAKVSTVSTWSRRVEQQFPDICKESMYAWGETIPYTAGTDEVKRFRQAMQRTYGDDFMQSLHIWHLEGWLAAKMFTDGVRRMGAAVTRKGLIDWLNDFTPDDGYGGGGLIVPQSWQPIRYGDVGTYEECIALAKWDMGRHDFFSVGSYPYCDPKSAYIPWAPAQ